MTLPKIRVYPKTGFYCTNNHNNADVAGCYYQFEYYAEGEQIVTSEPCLNCTCHNQMLMCYLNVCPFIKPVGKNCVVEHRDDQCCPTIMCPQSESRMR